MGRDNIGKNKRNFTNNRIWEFVLIENKHPRVIIRHILRIEILTNPTINVNRDRILTYNKSVQSYFVILSDLI